jgi:hypothetical protein
MLYENKDKATDEKGLREAAIKETVAIFDKHASSDPHSNGGNNAIVHCTDELRAEIAALLAHDPHKDPTDD